MDEVKKHLVKLVDVQHYTYGFNFTEFEVPLASNMTLGSISRNVTLLGRSSSVSHIQPM